MRCVLRQGAGRTDPLAVSNFSTSMTGLFACPRRPPAPPQLEKRNMKVLGFPEDNIRQLQRAYDLEWERDKVELEKR